MLNFTHDRSRKSWVASANQPETDFPIQNLPFGAFRRSSASPSSVGVAIGDQVLDLTAALHEGLFSPDAEPAVRSATRANLDPLLQAGSQARTKLREELSMLLAEATPAGDHARHAADKILVPIRSVEMLTPASVKNFTDMSVSSFHVGRARGNDDNGDPITAPVFKWQPIGYNGRASSVVVSGAPIARPCGVHLPPDAADDAPRLFGPEPRLDYEMELAVWITGGNALGSPIPIGEAHQHVFGFSLLNDWSARRLQVHESILGPFTGKSFATSVSPWIVTPEALAPFATGAFARPNTAPPPLPHLWCGLDQERGGYDIRLDAFIQTEKMRRTGVAPALICATNTRYLYWTWAQIIAHNSANGCNLGPGDLIGSGTVSGPSIDEAACLAEKTNRSTTRWQLPNGEDRLYLEDGDTVILRGRAERDGFASIGFGECAGTIVAAGAGEVRAP